MDFVKTQVDAILYYLVVGEEVIILVLYVDDMLLTGALELIEDCKRNLAEEFEMKDIGLMHQIKIVNRNMYSNFGPKMNST